MVSSWRFVSFYISWDCSSLVSFSCLCLCTFHWDRFLFHFISRFLIPWKEYHWITYSVMHFLLKEGRKMQTSLLKHKSQVLAGGVSPPCFFCEDLCPWAALESPCWCWFCSLPLPIRRALYCWSSARHLLYYLVNVMDATFSASSLFGAKTWDCKLEGD